jgi:hypothetical protein
VTWVAERLGEFDVGSVARSGLGAHLFLSLFLNLL